MMETLNRLSELADAGEPVSAAELRIFAQCLAPYAPFGAEAAWKTAGGRGSVHASGWPVFDPALELEEQLTIAVQVNGRLRATINVSAAAEESDVRRLAEAQESVSRYLTQGKIERVIYAPGRTINFVVKK